MARSIAVRFGFSDGIRVLRDGSGREYSSLSAPLMHKSGRRPLMRQQLLDVKGSLSRQPHEHILEISVRVMPIDARRLNGHDPYAYLKDVLTRLLTQRVSDILELLPHRWCVSLTQ